MPGRKLLTDADWIPTHFGANDPEMIRRRQVFGERFAVLNMKCLTRRREAAKKQSRATIPSRLSAFA